MALSEDSIRNALGALERRLGTTREDLHNLTNFLQGLKSKDREYDRRLDMLEGMRRDVSLFTPAQMAIRKAKYVRPFQFSVSQTIASGVSGVSFAEKQLTNLGFYVAERLTVAFRVTSGVKAGRHVAPTFNHPFNQDGTLTASIELTWGLTDGNIKQDLQNELLPGDLLWRPDTGYVFPGGGYLFAPQALIHYDYNITVATVTTGVLQFVLHGMQCYDYAPGEISNA